MVKKSSLVATRGCREIRALSKPRAQRTAIVWPSGWFPRRRHSPGWFYLIRLRAIPVWKASGRAGWKEGVSETTRSNYLRLQLPEIVDNRANSRLTRILKRKSWGMRFCRGFEKLQHIPGDLQGHMCVQGYARAQERFKKALSSYCLLTWRLCGSCKGRLRWIVNGGQVWKVCHNMHREPPSKEWETCWLHAFREICLIISWPLNYLGTFMSHKTEYTLYRISSGK